MVITITFTPCELAIIGAAVNDWIIDAEMNNDRGVFDELTVIHEKIIRSFDEETYHDAIAELNAKEISEKLKKGEL